MLCNTITVVGNVTHDPVIRYAASGKAILHFSIASTPRYLKDNKWSDGQVTYYEIEQWGEPAIHAADSLTKGMRVVVAGVLYTQAWETKDGKQRTTMKLRAEEVAASMTNAKVTAVKAGPRGPRLVDRAPDVDPWTGEPVEMADVDTD